jgi:hypothetical protein
VTVFLNPKRDLTDLPLKHYYRYVLPTGDDASDLAPAAGEVLPRPVFLYRRLIGYRGIRGAEG